MNKVLPTTESPDAIDELVSRSKDHPELRAFHRLHRAHPEVLDFLVSEIQLRIAHGFRTFSFHSLWHYARWKLEMDKAPGDTFLMNDHAAPYFARAITILHPEFNGRAEFRRSNADLAFGTEMGPIAPGGSRKLRWSNGDALEVGWRPTKSHVPHHEAKKRQDIH